MKKRRRWINFFYVPAVVFMSLFVVWPLIKGFSVSFYQWNGYSARMKPVGFENYVKLFADRFFISSFWNTILYGVGSCLLQNVFGLLIAVFLNSKFKGRHIVRTIVYLPTMISGLVMGYIMYFFVQYNHGIFNDLLKLFGVEPIDWLRDANRGKLIITLINSWQFVGGPMVIYIAGLQNIPQMYYDAAEIDGASPRKRFFHVTVPLLLPAMSTAVVTNLIGGLKLHDVIVALTSGGPAQKTHSLSTYISYEYFTAEKAGYASAIGIFLFAFIFVTSTLLNRFFHSREVEY